MSPTGGTNLQIKVLIMKTILGCGNDMNCKPQRLEPEDHRQSGIEDGALGIKTNTIGSRRVGGTRKGIPNIKESIAKAERL